MLSTLVDVANAAALWATNRSSTSSGNSWTGKYEMTAGVTVRSISARPYTAAAAAAAATAVQSINKSSTFTHTHTHC